MTRTDAPNNIIDAPSRIHYAASDLVNDADILMFDEMEPGASTNALKPENQQSQVSVDVSNKQYDINLHQGPVISPISSRRDRGTFVEGWLMEDSDSVWAMQLEDARFPEYQPHLHYSRESSLRGALGDFIYNPLSYM